MAVYHERARRAKAVHMERQHRRRHIAGPACHQPATATAAAAAAAAKHESSCANCTSRSSRTSRAAAWPDARESTAAGRPYGHVNPTGRISAVVQHLR